MSRGSRPKQLPPLFLCELLAGRQPSHPFAMGFTLRHLSPPLEQVPPGSPAEVYLGTIRRFLRPGRPYQRSEFIKALRHFIPTDAIQDVLVDGRSWGEVD